MSAAEQRVPALDMGVLEAVERKQSFTKKMSKKIKNLVTPRGKPGSPTGQLSNSSSSASLIRVPSISKAAPKPAAPEPAKAEAAPKAAEEPAAEAVIPIAAADVSAAFAEPAAEPAPQPAAQPAAVTEPAPAEPAPVAQAQPAAEEKQAEPEAAKARGGSPFRPLFTVALLAAAAGAAIVLGGSGAAAKAPAGKRGSWRSRQ
jgi:hypothetical protein